MTYQPPQPSELPSRPSDPTATQAFGLSHTMFRITDPRKSIPFYVDTLGMTVVARTDSAGGRFTNYFLAYPQSPIPQDPGAANQWVWRQQGLLELCHNWGNETDGTKYCNGNEPDHRGFGHICVFVDDLQKAVIRFDKLGVNFTKRPEDGVMKHIAFITDPDGYMVEVITRSRF